MANTHYDATKQTPKVGNGGRDATNQADRTLRNVTDEATTASRHAVEAGAEMTRRSAETAQDLMRSGLSSASQVAQGMTDQFRQALGWSGGDANELVQQTRQNIEVVTEASNVLIRGAQDLSREWVEFARERFQTNLDGLNALAQSRSVPDVVAAQTRLVRDNLEQMIAGTRRMAELSLAVSQDAAKTIAKAERTADRARRTA